MKEETSGASHLVQNEIIYPNTNRGVEFCAINGGQPFIHCDELYMKIDAYTALANAVRLSDGRKFTFKSQDRVILKSISISVKDVK